MILLCTRDFGVRTLISPFQIYRQNLHWGRSQGTNDSPLKISVEPLYWYFGPYSVFVVAQTHFGLQNEHKNRKNGINLIDFLIIKSIKSIINTSKASKIH